MPVRRRAPLERRPEPVRAAVLVPFRRSLHKATDKAAARTQGKAGGDGSAAAPAGTHSVEDRLAEAAGLARAIQRDVVVEEVVPLPHPRPATLFGSGRVTELAELIGAHAAGRGLVAHARRPVRQRKLGKAWSCKLLDRTGLTLEIFGQRARTREGRLQVELAHLTSQKSRLVRTWTHLERQ